MEVPRHWRLKNQRYRLVGNVCPTCGQVLFPPRPFCPDCAAQPVGIDRRELKITSLLKPTVSSVSSKG